MDWQFYQPVTLTVEKGYRHAEVLDRLALVAVPAPGQAGETPLRPAVRSADLVPEQASCLLVARSDKDVGVSSMSPGLNCLFQTVSSASVLRNAEAKSRSPARGGAAMMKYPRAEIRSAASSNRCPPRLQPTNTASLIPMAPRNPASNETYPSAVFVLSGLAAGSLCPYPGRSRAIRRYSSPSGLSS